MIFYLQVYQNKVLSLPGSVTWFGDRIRYLFYSFTLALVGLNSIINFLIKPGTTTIYITLVNIDVENGMKAFKGFYKSHFSVKIFRIGGINKKIIKDKINTLNRKYWISII